MTNKTNTTEPYGYSLKFVQSNEAQANGDEGLQEDQ